MSMDLRITDETESYEKVVSFSEEQYAQIYKELFKGIVKLRTKCAWDLMFWSIFNVEDDNTFNYSKKVFQRFNEEIQEFTGKSYSMSSVTKALREITDAGLYTKTEFRGVYMVNPVLFWAWIGLYRAQMSKEVLEKMNESNG